MITTDALIEALLFSRAEPWEVREIEKSLGKEKGEIEEALLNLEERLQDRGLVLVRKDTTVTLGTHPEAHEVLQKLYKEELEKGLSKASVETLSVILYGEYVTRGMIDYIRGVNSSFILRSLLVRGLIERKNNPVDRKRSMYVPTLALLASLGVAKREDLPEFEKISAELTKQLANKDNGEESTD